MLEIVCVHHGFIALHAPPKVKRKDGKRFFPLSTRKRKHHVGGNVKTDTLRGSSKLQSSLDQV